MVRLVLLVVEVILVMLTKFSQERVVVGCSSRTGTCRTFCVEIVPHTAHVVLRPGRPLVHYYTSLDSAGIF